MSKDYYKILGIAEFETAENIKLAYRKLARKLHPDVAGSSREALARFKEINEAYEILSNKVKKEEYDRARRFYSYAKNNSDQSYKQTEKKQEENKTKKNNSFSFNWEEFLSKKHRNESFQRQENLAPQKGSDINTDIEITVFEALCGTCKTVNMLQKSVCPVCNGRKFANGTICKHCQGKGEFTEHKKFNIKIPAEIKDGSKIRLAGEGNKGLNGGKNGDLYITIHVKETQNYKTDGLNIIKTVPITPFEAVLGAKIKISTLNGIINLNILPNTQNGQKFRLSNCGIVQNDKIGDMIITVEIKIPKNLTKEELELYKKLGEISSSNIRDDIYDK
ncbi:MAG: hypothetical protein E7Z89_01860 [Cyanobacteria bacterium SIG28]|nr:hypothetical protein [Cyanobacteria bacterium SIG28]